MVNGIYLDYCKLEIRIMEVNWDCMEKIFGLLLFDIIIRILIEFF